MRAIQKSDQRSPSKSLRDTNHLMKQLLLLTLLGGTIVVKAINPERGYKFTPDMRGFKYAEYKTKTTDGYAINVWDYEVAGAKSDRTIILVGPDAGNMGYLIWQANALLQKGIHVVSFDYRGFGNSADFEINKDFLFYQEFGLDLDSVIKATREKYPTHKIGLYAMSMGTYVSLLSTEKVDFLVAEGFYHHPQRVVDRIKANKGEVVLLPAGSKAIRTFRNRCPILIFCADGDQTTTTADAREFSLSNRVTLIEFKGSHLSGMNVFRKDEYGDQYAQRIVDFLAASRL